MSILPSHVDTIIIGTGLTNSILAAACSRIGKSVLHLDENTYYGDHESSFTYLQLIDWIKEKYPGSDCTESIPQELVDKSRMLCLDLAPKFLFSNGSMVDLLVKSNVSRYHEFKNNIRILCIVGKNDIHVMPCRRDEVFTSPLLPDLVDKRRLMKFIEDCIKHADQSDADDGSPQNQSAISKNGDKPIEEYLKERGLKSTLREYIINSIAMTHPTDTTIETCKKIKRFMIAMQKYGMSPFLFPLYGCGEFPQSFCRMSAVFGGVYCLDTKVKEAKRIEPTDDETNPQQSRFVVKFGDVDHCVTSDTLVVDQQNAIKLGLRKDILDCEKKISRAILITRKSIVASTDVGDDHTIAKDLISFLRIPPTSDYNKEVVYLIELNSSALICPRGMNVVYIWTQSTPNQTAEQDLKPTIERLYPNDIAPEEWLIWKFYYQQVCYSAKTLNEDKLSTSTTADGLFCSNSTFDDIDYASVIQEAESLFKIMCPNQEFLPRAPDPDEIIHSD